MTLAALGWTQRRQLDFASHTDAGLVPGRIVGEHRTHFQVATDAGELSAEITGRLRNDALQRSDLPGVGDFVALRPAAGDGPASLESVLTRSSALIRKASGEERPQLIAANVDIAFIVMGLDGDFNLARLERFLTLVRESRARPIIIANKADLSSDANAAVADIAAVAPGIPAHVMSARDGRGVEVLASYFQGNQTAVLVGSSGAGKSTLTNALLGSKAQATGDVRAHDSRGCHTTTHRQLFLRPGGGSIIDTPGMRGLEAWTTHEPILADFTDIEALAARCRFRDCRHLTEPACAVRAALKAGSLDPARYEAFSKMRSAR